MHVFLRFFKTSRRLFYRQLLHKNESKNFKVDEDTFKYIYGGPLGRTIHILKRISLTTTAIASLLISFVYYKFPKDSEKSKKFRKYCGVVCLMFACLSIIILNLVTRSYVKKLYFSSSAVEFKMETINILSMTKTTYFKPDDVKFDVRRLFNNIQIKEKYYFLHLEMPEAQQALNFIAKYKELDKITEQSNKSN